jgi:type IV pilus assembly protein PilA
MRNNKGFSLVELMIVVAIIGILAAIAIPNFIAMQLKAKRAEVPGNVDGIKTSELAYDAAFDAFVDATKHPSADSTKLPVAWDPAAVGFATIGWQPDGKVRGNYAVAAEVTDFLVTGNSDVDGDGARADYSCSTSTNATLATADSNVY